MRVFSFFFFFLGRRGGSGFSIDWDFEKDVGGGGLLYVQESFSLGQNCYPWSIKLGRYIRVIWCWMQSQNTTQHESTLLLFQYWPWGPLSTKISSNPPTVTSRRMFTPSPPPGRGALVEQEPEPELEKPPHGAKFDTPPAKNVAENRSPRDGYASVIFRLGDISHACGAGTRECWRERGRLLRYTLGNKYVAWCPDQQIARSITYSWRNYSHEHHYQNSAIISFFFCPMGVKHREFDRRN